MALVALGLFEILEGGILAGEAAVALEAGAASVAVAEAEVASVVVCFPDTPERTY